MPIHLPADYPKKLIPLTRNIIAEAMKEFPEYTQITRQTQITKLCKRVVSKLTPRLCAAVQDEALSVMDELLHYIRVANCDGSSEMERIRHETMESDEWRKLVEEMAGVPIAGSPQSSGAGTATWDTIEISFLSDERIQIYNGTDTKPYNYAEFGFADSRNGKPNQAWVTLRDLAEAKGIILINARRVSPWPKVEKRIQEIRKALRDHFGITSDPFLFKDGIGYQARFKIGVSPSFHT